MLYAWNFIFEGWYTDRIIVYEKLVTLYNIFH